jgi:hypothetical protein
VHGYGGIIPSKPFETLGNLDGYPYPLLGVRVLVGIGKGTEKKPKGYPGYTLLVADNASHVHLCTLHYSESGASLGCYIFLRSC